MATARLGQMATTPTESAGAGLRNNHYGTMMLIMIIVQ